MRLKNGEKCATCRSKIEEGMDVLEVQEGIIGLRGFVSLEKPLLFCCAECMKKFFTPSSGYEKLPKRIP